MIIEMQQIDLTVLFASRNGEKVISRTLSAYRHIKQANVSWKLVIVDNGSSDSTLEIIKYFQQHLPIEVCFEPVAGKNRALNRGLHAVEGQLIVVTDDDTLPSPSFLQAWAKFIDRNSDYGLFGGSITPLFESPPQSWLTVDQSLFIMLFGARDLPEGPVEPEEIFGGNMAVRRAVFDRGFRFNEKIGPNGIDPIYPMGGETEFCRRVVQAGVLSWFAREPVVQHLIQPYHMTDRYLADRSYRSGRGAAYQLKIKNCKLRESELVALRRDWRRRCRLCCQLRMLSPFSSQRRRAIHRYYQMRGFTDELNS
jgi:glycosyltransferase involved in cell wall biosynthesis